MNQELKERIFRGDYIPLEEIADKVKGVSYRATIYVENIRADHFYGLSLSEVEKEAYARAFALLCQNNLGNTIKIKIMARPDGDQAYIPLRGIIIRSTDISQGREDLLKKTTDEYMKNKEE